MKRITKVLTTLAAIVTVGAAQAGSLGFDHHADGTHTAKWRSDSSSERCSQMAPKVSGMPGGYCAPMRAQSIGPVWCDESRFCPVGLCHHYAYLRFRCIADENAPQSVDEREIIILD